MTIAITKKRRTQIRQYLTTGLDVFCYTHDDYTQARLIARELAAAGVNVSQSSIILVDGFHVRTGGRAVAVKNYDEASDAVIGYIELMGLASSTFRGAAVYQGTKKIARVSYNGRVWNLDGTEIQTHGQPTAAQRESEGWK